MSPQISVIIPLFNKESSIKQTVESVLNQTYKFFELIVVDDGSTDNSIENISSIADKRLQIITKKNGGVSDTRNFGIAAANYEYIFFLDADDTIMPDCLLSFSELIKKYKEQSIFTSNFKIRDQHNREYLFCKDKLSEGIVKNSYKSLWNKEIYPRTGTMVIMKECFNEVGYFNNKIGLHEDSDLILRLLKCYKVVYTPVSNFTYILESNHESTKVHALDKEFAYYISLKDKTFYEKLILSVIIYKAFIKRKQLSDIAAQKYLIKKNFRNIIVIMISIILVKINDKINSPKVS